MRNSGELIIGYVDGCAIVAHPNGDRDIWCKMDNGIGESAIQKDPYRSEIATDTSRLPKPSTEYKNCWE
ncbi:MAG: hypothetical protein GXO16_04735 [Epsilonproteobacteria bacterium]|nr:hypothetical protein [Campylobacterota bacterium]